MSFGGNLASLERIIRNFNRARSISAGVGPSAISATALFELVAFTESDYRGQGLR